MMSDEGKLWKQGEMAEAQLRESGVIYENQVINEYLTGILERLQPFDTTKRRLLQTGFWAYGRPVAGIAMQTRWR